MKKVILFLFLYSFTGLLLAQGTFKLEAPDKVSAGQVFSVRLSISDSRGLDFEAPSFEGFKVVSGPSVSQMSQNINGRRSSSKTYTYQLLAMKPGKGTIGSAKIKVKGISRATRPKTIEIVKGKVQQNAGHAVLILLTADTTTAYVGQQITLTYHLLTNKEVSGLSYLHEDEYRNFDHEEVDFEYEQDKYFHEGAEYDHLILKQVLLYPKKVGEFEIEPLIASVQIPTGSGHSFFRNVRKENHGSNKLTIKVLDGAGPAISEKEARGVFDIALMTDLPVMSMNDAAKLTVRITGKGQLDAINAPELYLDDNFEAYEPEIRERQLMRKEGLFIEKSFIYDLVPLRVSQTNIKASFEYFDLDSLTTQKKISRPYRVKVTPARDGLAGLQSPDSSNSQLAMLSPLIFNHVSDKESNFFSSWLHFLLFALCLIPFVLSYLRGKKEEDWNALDTNERKRRLAWKKISSHFTGLEANLSTWSARQFYEEGGVYFESYLRESFKIPAADFSIERVRTDLHEKSASEDLKAKTVHLLQMGQMARFARVEDGKTAKSLFEEMKDVVLSIEDLKKTIPG